MNWPIPLTSRPWGFVYLRDRSFDPYSGLDVGQCSIMCSDDVDIWIVAYLNRV